MVSILELLGCGAGALLALTALIQIAPIKVNPWSSIAKAVGRAINADVLNELNTVKQDLANHIRTDGEGIKYAAAKAGQFAAEPEPEGSVDSPAI